MSEKNLLGGGNPLGLYMPMSDTEQEVLNVLVERDDLEVEIVGWGVMNRPRLQFGDKRISIEMPMTFSAPDQPMPVYFFDLILRTRAGFVIHQERLPTLYDNQPIMVGTGIEFLMYWDIAILKMNPRFVKMVLPQKVGMTSRLDGNLGFDSTQQQVFQMVQEADKTLREADQRTVERLVKRHGVPVVKKI